MLYLLDGLDELGGKRPSKPDEPDGEQYDPRAQFIRELQTQLSTDRVVVTSRSADYEQIGRKMALPGAVTLQALTNAQIKEYLLARCQSDLLETLRADPALMEMARTPLLLSLLSIAFGHEAGKPRLDLADLDEARIFDRYIHRRFVHEASRPKPLPFDEPITREMLGKLATHMWQDLWPKVTLTLVETRDVLGIRGDTFVTFARRMHFLQLAASGEVQFVHLKLRNYCAISSLLRSLGNTDREIRLAAARKLGQIGDVSSVPGLLKALEVEDDRHARKAIVQALGQIGDASAVPDLVDTLEDLDLTVREAAVKALGAIRDSSAIPYLIENLRADDDCVRIATAWALEQIGDVTAVPALIDALEDIDWEVRKAVINALDEIGYNVATLYTADLIELLYDSDELVRSTVATVLETITVKDPQYLVDLLYSTDDDVRYSAAKELIDASYDSTGEIPDYGDHVHEREWIEALNEPDDYVRYRSSGKPLEEIGDAVVPSLLKLLHGPNPEAREFAIEALVKIGVPAVAGLIDSLFDADEWVCWYAAWALERIGTPEALTAIKEWRRHKPDTSVEEIT